MKRKTVFFYILGQITPTFLLGIFIFIFIILMFKSIKLIEIVLTHDVDLPTVLFLLANVSIGSLPIILPMSLLFSILLTYSRLSANSEVVALRALGYTPLYLSLPAIIFSFVITILSMQTLFVLGPTAQFQFRKTKDRIVGQIAMSDIKEGTFSEEFFGLVLYTNEIDQQTKTLKNLFISDYRDAERPTAIVAKEGIILSNNDSNAQLANITLKDGYIYPLGQKSKAKVKFEESKINISKTVAQRFQKNKTDTYTQSDIDDALSSDNTSDDFKKKLEIEKYRRWAIAFSCLLFGFLGSALGSNTNRRTNASAGFVLSVVCIVGYWLLYMVSANIAKTGYLPPALSLWLANIVFLGVTVKAWYGQYTAA